MSNNNSSVSSAPTASPSGDGDGGVWKIIFSQQDQSEVIIGCSILIAVVIIFFCCLYYKICKARRYLNTVHEDATGRSVQESRSAAVMDEETIRVVKANNLYIIESDGDSSEEENVTRFTPEQLSPPEYYTNIQLHGETNN